MNFDELLQNQKDVIRLFQNSLKKNRIVHTYLLEGEKGVGLIDAAYYLAALILCEAEDNKPCLKCSSCLKVLNNTHQNIFFIAPEKEAIKKEQIDALEHEFSLTALGLEKRVFIIKNIETATQASSNSLLKFLEEANPNNYGILLTENINLVLPTIKSRSQVVSFKKLPKEIIASKLEKEGISSGNSLILSSITNSVDEALELASDPKVTDIIDLVRKIAINLETRERDTILMFYESSKLLLGDNNKKYNLIFLNLLITYLNDELLYQMNQLDRITFKNDIETLAIIQKKKNDVLVKEIEIVLKFKERLSYNVNMEMMYYQMFIELQGGING